MSCPLLCIDEYLDDHCRMSVVGSYASLPKLLHIHHADKHLSELGTLTERTDESEPLSTGGMRWSLAG